MIFPNWGPAMKTTLSICIIIFFAILIDRTLRYLTGRYLQASARRMNTDQTRFVFLKHVVSAVIYILAIIAIASTLPRFKTFAVSLFASAGILAAIIGFASQAAFSNIISGIFMVISRPFKVGDRISLLPNITGVVEDITLRHTVIRSPENRRVVIPNSRISSEIIVNADLYDEKVCEFMDFSVSLSSDIEAAMRIIQEEAEKHPYCIDCRNQHELSGNEPPVQVRLTGFGPGHAKLRGSAWAANASAASKMRHEVNLAVKKRFDNEGIVLHYA